MCAAVSMPRASPEAMTNPSSARSVASARVNFWPTGGAVARTDNGDHGNVGELEPAFDVEQRRRRIDLGERRRIAGLADGDQIRAQAFGERELSLGFGLGAEANIGPAAAA